METLTEEIAIRQAFCQLCGYMPEDENLEPLNEWWIYSFNSIWGLIVYIVACPRCKEIEPEVALSIYRKRVSAGLDINFH